MSSELEQLRAELTRADTALLECVAERQRIVEAIGKSKRSSGTATRDYGRERRVIEQAREQADRLNLDHQLGDSLMRRLIESSHARQEIDRVKADAQGQNRSALVFGGRGKMGRWFADFLASQKFDVKICDPGDGPAPA